MRPLEECVKLGMGGLGLLGNGKVRPTQLHN